MSKGPLPSSRRAARETALRILYMVEVGKGALEEAQDDTIAANELDAEAAEFTRALVQTIRERQQELDESITAHSLHYAIDRQIIVDRIILRIATAEILHGISGAPMGVIANEAVELAKKYSTPEAAKFINGVIGGMIRTHSEDPENLETEETELEETHV